jgi:predicted hotdog family 3-hydroxylacyl-ACP dehydratase/3-hydroxymyristoyl/3-hydroxydecanoyl-(acyl carrier protein) dehydratase
MSSAGRAGRAGFRFLGIEPTPEWAAARASARAPAAGGRRGGGAEPAAPIALAEIEVPAAGSPIFAGHFPGHPVLPGIAHLALVQEALAALGVPGDTGGGDPNVAIVEVRTLRLRRAVVPGDRLTLRLEAAGGGAGAGSRGTRFELRRLAAAADAADAAGEIASQGTVLTALAAPESIAAAPEAVLPACLAPRLALRLAPTPSAAFPPVAELLPHAPPARLLAAVLSAGDGGIVCTGIVPASHPLAAAGAVAGFLAIELAAQAAAAHEALQRQRRHATRAGARIGYLVGVREVRLPRTLPTGRTLRVTAIPTGGAAALTTYEMDIVDEAASAAGERLAAGSLSTFLPDL